MVMPLEGIRILDWTIWQHGSIATSIMGDLGAEVIKIEDRNRGDPGRGLAQLVGKVTGLSGRNWYFELCNRSKKAITLNLTKDEGKEIVYKLVKNSDVFVQNMRLGVSERLGLDYKTLSAHNPRLIYASASGYGPVGPATNDPAFDLAGQARSGVMTIVGEPEMPPLILQGGIADQMGAITLAFAVVTAIAARERHGVGQEVNTSMVGSMISLMSLGIGAQLLGYDLHREARATANNPLWNYYKCKDGKWIVLAHLQSDKHWPSLCQALKIEHLEKDPRFDGMQARAKNCVELISIMDAVFATRTRAEWMDTLRQAGNLIFQQINDISDVGNDPQLLANGYIQDFLHPAWGTVKVVGSPMKFSKTPATIQSEAPEFGQHTEEVLREILGYSWEEISKLKESEVI